MLLIVRSGLVIACRLASWPTSLSPLLLKPTTDGQSRLPSASEITVGSLPSITATTELVVPRSIPTIFAKRLLLLVLRVVYHHIIGILGGVVRHDTQVVTWYRDAIGAFLYGVVDLRFHHIVFRLEHVVIQLRIRLVRVHLLRWRQERAELRRGVLVKRLVLLDGG